MHAIFFQTILIYVNKSTEENRFQYRCLIKTPLVLRNRQYGKAQCSRNGQIGNKGSHYLRTGTKFASRRVVQNNSSARVVSVPLVLQPMFHVRLVR